MTRNNIFLSFVIFSLLIVFSSATAFGYHQRQVLGQTTTTVASIPPTIEGPGLILPDSPLFFLDQIKQNVRLLLAFSPEAKAKVHADIAGERLAELRFMLTKQNDGGIEVALKGISQNLSAAAKDITDAKMYGKDVSVLAKEINTTIKAKQETLDGLEEKTKGAMKQQVKTVNQGLLEAKVKVEDSLPASEIENEIRNDLRRIIKKRLEDASESSARVEDEIEALQKQASDSAKDSLKNREKMLKEAIETKNEFLKKERERDLQIEKRKQETVGKAENEAIEEARKAINAAKKAAEKMKKAEEIRVRSISDSAVIKESESREQTIVNKNTTSELQEKTTTSGILKETDDTDKEEKE